MADFLDPLKSLHTTLIDACNGYEEAAEDDEGKDLGPLFSQMVDLRNRHDAELDRHLRAVGEEPNVSGSFMTLVHRTIFKVRSVVTGLDASVIPGLINGEERIVESYEDVLRANPPADVATTINRQLAEV
jgi:uncharacterized protein (TIGR02284 family)